MTKDRSDHINADGTCDRSRAILDRLDVGAQDEAGFAAVIFESEADPDHGGRAFSLRLPEGAVSDMGDPERVTIYVYPFDLLNDGADHGDRLVEAAMSDAEWTEDEQRAALRAMRVVRHSIRPNHADDGTDLDDPARSDLAARSFHLLDEIVTVHLRPGTVSKTGRLLNAGTGGILLADPETNEPDPHGSHRWEEVHCLIPAEV